MKTILLFTILLIACPVWAQKTKSEQNELSDFDLPQIKDDKNDINSRNLSMIKPYCL